MKKNYLVPIFSLSLIFCFVLAGCSTAQSVVTPTPYPTPVRTTYTVQRGDIVINVELFGRVTPRALNTVYFQMSGHVSDVYAQVNDTVKKGQLLADLVEQKDLQAQATATRDAIRRAQINLQIAQLTLDKYKADGHSDYDIQIQELQVELAQIDLDEVFVKYGIDPASNALDELDAQVAKAKVFAPADGVIISGVNPGRAVSNTTVAFTIGDGSQFEIVADVNLAQSDEQIKDMFEGMPVVVTPNSRPDLKWAGKISLLPSPYGTGEASDKTVHVVLDQAPSSENYKSGDTVTVLVQLANKTGILWLPPAAIREVGGRTFVVVNGDNGPQRVDIEIGLKTQDRIEIVSGLDEGQVVIGQ
jgi:macrolide-specific efflux system membrane fusion protein